MRSRYGIFAVVCIAALGAVLLGAAGNASAAKYVLSYSTTATPDSFQGEAEKIFMEEVEKATNGEVGFHVMWGGGMVSATETLRGVADGVVDLARQNPNFFPRQLLYNNAISILQILPAGYLDRVRVFNKILDEVPEMRAEFTKYNQTIVYTYNAAHYCIVSTKPMTKLEDIKGLKVRTSARWQLNLVRDAGALPVSIPFADVPMSLQTNAMDATLFSVDAIDMTGVGDVAPNILMIPQLGVSSPFYVTINNSKFKSLPPEIQAKFAEAADAATVRFAARHDEIYQSILKKWADRGYTVTVAGPEFVEKWLALPSNKTNIEDWVREAEADGAKDARDIVTKVFRIMEEAVAAENAAR